MILYHILLCIVFSLLTIHVRHVDGEFDEVGEVGVVWAGVADLSREGFCSHGTWDAGLTHTYKEIIIFNTYNTVVSHSCINIVNFKRSVVSPIRLNHIFYYIHEQSS